MTDIHPQRFEIWYADMPYLEDRSKSKKRTVLVFAWNEDECVGVVIKVTSKLWHDEPGDLPLFDWKNAGLRVPSLVRCSQVVRLPRASFIYDHPFGRLSARDARRVYACLASVHPELFAPDRVITADLSPDGYPYLPKEWEEDD